MTAPYRISVVIPTYRRCRAVRQLLEQLAQQTAAPDEYEVIVSIDGSDDGTREAAARFHGPYQLRTLWQPHRGRAAACNAGIRAAKGDLIVLLDDDMAPVPGFVRAHQAAHAGESRCAVLGAVPITVPPSAPPVAAYVAAKFSRHLEKLARPDHVFSLRDFYSGNLSIRRTVLFEVGLFDERFTLYGNEDLELSLRLSRAGIHFKYSAQALAHQSYLKTFPELAHDTIAKGRTAVLLADKHPRAFDDLKLATFHDASRRWRFARNLLLRLSGLFCPLPDCVATVVTLLERWRPRRLRLLYDFVLDYFYWLGAGQAMGRSRFRTLRARRR
jgi:glycosyltransferase involved in cell wall biosynthesis